MGCCGRTRAQLSVPGRPTLRTMEPAAQGGVCANSQPPPLPPASVARIQVRYTGQPAIVVRGPVSGLPYSFSRATPVLAVDRRDALVFLRTRHFRSA